MRRALAALLALFLVGCGGQAALSSPAAAPAKPASAGAIPTVPPGTTVSITTATGVPSAVFTAEWIAIDKGYFKQHGLDAKLQEIEGVVQTQAIVAGEIQIGSIGGAEILDSRVAGAPIIGILQNTDSPVFQIHAPPSIKRVEDLKGKTVAITRVGSSTDMAARVMLVRHGLTPDKDVTLLAANNMPGILAAMQTGQVQAGAMSPPTTVMAEKAGFPKVASAVDEQVPLQQGFNVTTRTYADQHPEVVYSYLQGYLEGLRDFFNDSNLAISTIGKYTKSDPDTARTAYEAMRPAMDPVGIIDPAGLKTVQEFTHNTKTRELNLADAYDNRFLEALQASGFIAQLGIKK